jgi:photosystem II stability/assembly factor-like uncharacterized protein
VFAGTQQAGVFVSQDGGRSWEQLASGLTDLNVRSLVNIRTEIYAGTDTQGVFIRSGGAGSWDKLSHGLPVHAQVFDLAVSGRYVYAALYSKGLYRLDSGGGRWTKVGQVTPLEVLAQDSALLAGYNPGGVYRSVDEGVTWSLSSGLSSNAPIWTLGSAGSNLFAGTSPGAVSLSTDLGASWKPSAATPAHLKGSNLLFNNSPGVCRCLNGCFVTRRPRRYRNIPHWRRLPPGAYHLKSGRTRKANL